MKKVLFVLAITLGSLFISAGCGQGNIDLSGVGDGPCCVFVGNGGATSCTNNNVWCCFGDCNPNDECDEDELAQFDGEA